MIHGRAQKKPVKIDFFVWEQEQNSLPLIELFEWVRTFGQDPYEHFNYIAGGEIRVKTLEGTSYAVPEGYVIIRGVEGEYYPCEPKIFHKTYERAREEGVMVATSGDNWLRQNGK